MSLSFSFRVNTVWGFEFCADEDSSVTRDKGGGIKLLFESIDFPSNNYINEL